MEYWIGFTLAAAAAVAAAAKEEEEEEAVLGPAPRPPQHRSPHLLSRSMTR